MAIGLTPAKWLTHRRIERLRAELADRPEVEPETTHSAAPSAPQAHEEASARPIPRPPVSSASAGISAHHAARARRRGQRVVVGVLGESLDARLRRALRGLTVDTDADEVREVLMSAGLLLPRSTVARWLAGLREQSTT